MTGTDITPIQRKAIRIYNRDTLPKPKISEIVIWFKKKYKRQIHRRTISRSLSDKYSFLDEINGPLQKNTRIRSSHWPELEKLLHEWFVSIDKSGGVAGETDILNKAREIWAKIKKPGETDPKFSSGWLARVKARMGLRHKALSGEAESVSPKLAEKPTCKTNEEKETPEEHTERE